MATLAALQRERTGGRVIGFAPSEIAARQLEAEAALTLATNTARWLAATERNPERWGLRRDAVTLSEFRRFTHRTGGGASLQLRAGRCNTPADGGVQRVGVAAAPAGSAGEVLGSSHAVNNLWGRDS